MATVKLDPAKGVQIPNKTTTERNAISSPETGALIWNTTTSAINQYNGSAWEATDTNTQADITGKLNLSGGAMTGTITGFTSTGIDDNADATAITIDSSENVGINTTTPSSLLEVKAGSNSTTDYPITVLNSAESVTTGYGAYGIDQSASSQYTIDVHDDLVIKSNTGENLRILENGGISFNGDTAAANALDDYEEGDWTPLVTCSTSGSYNLTGGANLGAYTKVGRVVHVQGYIGVVSESSPNGSLRMALPFTAFTGTDDTDYAFGNAVITHHGGNYPSNINFFVQAGSYAYLWGVNDDGTSFYVDHNDVDTNFNIGFNFSYIAA